MALPAGITTCTVSAGPLVDFAGDDYVMTVEWQPVLDGVTGSIRSIVWEATGEPLVSFVEKIVSTVGEEVTFDLPHVDQAGFVDGTGAAVTGWFYNVVVSARAISNQKYRKAKKFQVVVGQSTADFDLIVDGTVAIPVTAPTPTVTSVNGETGAVVVPSAGDVTQAQETADAAQADATAALSGLATKVNTATYTAGLATKADLSADGRDALALADYDPMRSVYTALARRHSKRVNIGVGLASSAEGWPTSSFDRTIGQRLAASLRATYPTEGVTGGRGLIGVPTEGEGLASPVQWPLTRTGGVYDATAFALGAKHTCWYNNGAFHVLDTLDGPVTSFDIRHVRGTAGAIGGARWRVDGGAWTTFDTYSATSELQVLHVATPATTSIEVEWVGSGYFIFTGIHEYNGDENAGVQVHNLGHCGYTLDDWTVGAGGAGGWLDEWEALDLDLLILVDDGVNDGSNGYTAAAYAARLTTFIALLRANGIDCPIRLSAMWDPSAGVVLEDPYEDYVNARRGVADADPTLTFLDHSTRMPATSLSTTHGLYHTDTVHTDVAGDALQFIADTEARHLAPR